MTSVEDAMTRSLPSRTLAGLALALLVGCGLSEDKYATKIAVAQCALYEECGYLQAYGDTVAACESAIEELSKAYVTDETCDYDARAARQCLREVKETECDTDGEGDSSCDDVCGDGTAGEGE